MGKKQLPDMSHKLNVMCDHYGIELDHHQADSDSHACAEILLKTNGETELIRRAETPADYFSTFDCFDIYNKLK